MTPEELYHYDVNGYLLIEDAIEPGYLVYLNERLDSWEEKALQDFHALPKSANPEIRYDDILNQETSLLDLVVNPKVLPISMRWWTVPDSSLRG